MVVSSQLELCIKAFSIFMAVSVLQDATLGYLIIQTASRAGLVVVSI